VTELKKLESLWNVADAAAFLNTSRNAVYKLVERKQIPHFRLGRKVLFDPAKLRRWLEDHHVHAA
jgi:excisionase family DNA binding protein